MRDCDAMSTKCPSTWNNFGIEMSTLEEKGFIPPIQPSVQRGQSRSLPSYNINMKLGRLVVLTVYLHVITHLNGRMIDRRREITSAKSRDRSRKFDRCAEA